MALNHLQAGAIPASVAKGEIMDSIQIYNALLQTDYCAYVNHVHQGRWTPSKFHKFLCSYVQEFIERPCTNGVFDILCIHCPPQYGKSMSITETLPSWYLGKHPLHRVMEISYNDDFASKFGRRNREKIRAYGDIFGIDLSKSTQSVTEFELSNEVGGMYSVGVLAGATGHPCEVLIIDDPIKTAAEAASDNRKKQIVEEWERSFKTRVRPNGKVIVIMTRWVEDDLVGYLLENYADVCEYLCIPCEAEEDDPLGRKVGEGLCEEIGKGTAWKDQFKASYSTESGLMAWNAMYQGRPTSAEGNIIKREWWKYYDKLPDDIQEWVMSVDAAFKDGKRNDFVAIQVWGKRNTDMYLVDAVKEHLDFPATMNEIRRLRRIYSQCKTTLIEDKANGTAIITMLRKEMTGIIAINPIGGKVARVNAVTSAIESGNVHLPRNKNFTYDFVDECASFPNGKHDDQVDCMSQVLNRFVFHKADVPVKSKVKGLEKYFSNIKPKKPGIGKGEKIHVI